MLTWYAVPAVPAVPPAGLLELLCGLASVFCLAGSRQGVAFLPRCAADMLTQLPFLSAEHTAVDLLFHAEQLAAAGPAKLHTLQLRLGSLLAATVRRVAAAAAGGGEQAQSAKALLGRLALAAASLLSSLAAQATSASSAAGSGDGGSSSGSGTSSSTALPPGVSGALYSALAAAQGAAPELGLQRVQDARRVGPLVEAVRSMAASLGTALMQVTGQSFAGGWLLRAGAGLLRGGRRWASELATSLHDLCYGQDGCCSTDTAWPLTAAELHSTSSMHVILRLYCTSAPARRSPPSRWPRPLPSPRPALSRRLSLPSRGMQASEPSCASLMAGGSKLGAALAWRLRGHRAHLAALHCSVAAARGCSHCCRVDA